MVVGGGHIYIRNKYTYKVPRLVWSTFYQILMHYYRKKTNRGGDRISRGIQERTCGSSRGQSKKKWNFQGCWRKTSAEFPRCITQFCRISRGESLFSLEILSKFINLKFPGGFQKSMSSTPSLAFSWNSPIKQARS